MQIESHVVHDMGAERTARPVDGLVAELASRQHGVVSRAQLAELGLERSAIAHRLRSGRLHRVHRGVFAVGHPVLSRRGCWLAAVLAAGPGARLSHRSAAALWAIRDSGRTQVDVIAESPHRNRPGIHIREMTLAPDEVTVHAGIPVTNPARTLLDLAEVLTPHQLERAVSWVAIVGASSSDCSM